MATPKKSVRRGLTAKTKGKTPNRAARKTNAVKIGPGTSVMTAYKTIKLSI